MTSSKGTSGFRGKKGFTLIELMVVIAVLAIVMTLVYSIFISQLRAAMWKNQLTDLQENLKGAMNVLQADLRETDAIVNTPGICNTAIAMDIGGETITYYTNGTSAEPGWLRRDSTAAGRSAVLADNITCFKVECFDRNGAQMGVASLVNASAVSDVRRVTATICGKTARENPNTGEKAERIVKSSAEMRNIPQYSGTGCGVLYFSMSPTSAAFCDPPGQKPTISVKLCDLTGNAMSGDVQIFPKEPQPIQIDPLAGTSITTTDGVATMHISVDNGTSCDSAPWGEGIINATDPSSLPSGTGLEMVAIWQPEGCAYDISTSRSLTVKSGYAMAFESGGVTVEPTEVSAFCSAEGQTQEESELKVKVVDNCANTVTGETVTASIVGDDGTMGSLSSVEENAAGEHIVIYNAGSKDQDVTIRFEDSAIWNATDETFTDTITADGTVTINPAAPDDFNLVADPFAVPATMDECPGNSDAVRVEVLDACDNVITTDELGNLSVELDLTEKGAVRMEAGVGSEYNAIYNTPSDCGDGNLNPTMTISHSGFSNAANTVESTVDLTQCTLPTANLVVIRASDPPHQVASGCGRDDDPKNPFVTVSATVYKPDQCVAWPVDTLFEFESTSVEMDPNVYNGSFEDADTTKTVFTGTGVAQVRFFGINNTTSTPEPPTVGKNLKVRARAKLRYDPVTGDYEDYYEDSKYGDFASNLIEVVAPGVAIDFTDSTFANTVDFHPVDCTLPDTLYFRVDDCDGDLYLPITAVVNSVNVFGRLRDSETITLTGGGGFYNGSIPTSIAITNTIDDGKLKVGPADTITVYYTDGTDGSEDTASLPAAGFYDGLEGDVSDWTVTGSATPDVRWHIENYAGNNVFVYNDGVDFNPTTAARNYGELVSPPFYLDISAGTTLTFYSITETEETEYDRNYWDSRMLFINSTSSPDWTLIEPPPVDADDSLACSTGDSALCSVRSSPAKTFLLSTAHRVGLDLSDPALDLSGFDGQEVRLMFRFDTWDSVANTYFGWAFDGPAVTCNADITPPDAPVITGETLSGTTVRLVWPEVADAAGYTLFVYGQDDRTGRPDLVVEDITPNCTAAAGEVCYEHTQATLGPNESNPNGDWYFRVAAFDLARNLSAPSNSYHEESATILDITMTCHDEAASENPSYKKVVVKGTVTNLDGDPVGVSVDANFKATEETTLEPDEWTLITNASTGEYCGDNEEDGTTSPYTGGYNLTDTKMWATGTGFTNSAVKPFGPKQSCTCP